jgi:threonine dehydratase
VLLKLENLQETGSFKIRGAANAILSLGEQQRNRGVVTVSSGNHGRAVARVASGTGVRAVVCLSGRVPEHKAAAIAELGAEIVVAGPGQDEADAAARRLHTDEGLTFIHPFDDPAVIAGQGTIGLEILSQVADAGTIVVPLSGGGLISGIASLVKARLPGCRIVGVSQDRGPAMVESLAAGRIVSVVEEDTLADALAGGLGETNRHTLAMCAALLDDTVLVTEEEIACAMANAARRDHLTVEGGGAVGLAAVAADRVPGPGPVVVVVSGGNVAPRLLAELTGSSECP